MLFSAEAIQVKVGRERKKMRQRQREKDVSRLWIFKVNIKAMKAF